MRPVVFLVGGVPMPSGGVTIHVERLASLLSASGYRVEVFDVTGVRKRNRGHDGGAMVWSGRVAFVLLWLLARLIVMRPALVHWHLSSLARASRILFLMHAIGCLVATIATIHSGTFPSRFVAATPSVHRRFKRFANVAHALIGVNSELAEFLTTTVGVSADKVHAIPAYLRPERHNASAAAGARRSVIACGAGSSIYGWDQFIEASRIADVDECHMVFNASTEPDYTAGVLRRAATVLPGRVWIHRDLMPDDFLCLLRTCQVFVRPTLIDGDSLAVREALEFGLHVVASDAVARPLGCVVFRVGDSADLANKINEAFLNSSISIERKTEDFGEPLLSIYDVLSKSSLDARQSA